MHMAEDITVPHGILALVPRFGYAATTWRWRWRWRLAEVAEAVAISSGRIYAAPVSCDCFALATPPGWVIG